MSAEDELRLAWVAHGNGLPARRDALLTLAVASAGMGESAWVERVRAFLVASRTDHLYAGPAPLKAILEDPRVVAALMRLRQSYPPARVRCLVQRDAVGRGPYRGRSGSVASLVDDLMTPPRKARHRSRIRLGVNDKGRAVPVGVLAPVGPVIPREAGLPESAGRLLAFYVTVLLGVAALCAIALDDLREDRRAA